MTGPAFRPPLPAADEEAGRVAGALDATAAAVVIADDPGIAAEVAIALARVQARRRRVAVADLVGELQLVEDLVPTDPPYGIIDILEFGVSLGSVAHPVDPAGNLFVMPSGPGALDRDAILANAEWARLVDGFRRAEALLLLIAPADSPALPALVQMTDGVVLAGRATAPAGAHVLARLRAGASTPSQGNVLVDRTAASAASSGPVSLAVPSGGIATPRAPAAFPDVAPARSTSIPPWALIAAVIVVALALTTWGIATRTGTGRGATTAAVAPPPPDSGAARRSAAGDVPVASSAAAALAAPAIAGSADSARAAAFAVALIDERTASAAFAQLVQVADRGAPDVTYVPYAAGTDSTRPFRVAAGAFRDRSSADSLLRQLRAQHILRPRQGHVISAPFALLVQHGIAADQWSFFVTGYRTKGLPVYPLVQADGRVNLYAGAFDAPDAARALLAIFADRGEPAPQIAYRLGSAP